MASNNNNQTPQSAAPGPQQVTPPNPPSAPLLAATAAFNSMSALQRQRVLAQSHDFSDDEESDDDDSGNVNFNRSSAIHLEIDTATRIRGNNNTVSVEPAVNAEQIAINVTEALQRAAQGDGLPMIDENGRPRAIKIIVRAGNIVVGTGNNVGEKAVEGSEKGQKEKSRIAAGDFVKKALTDNLVRSLQERKRQREREGSFDHLVNGGPEKKRVKKE